MLDGQSIGKHVRVMDEDSDIINSETETDSESVDLTSVESQESSIEGRGSYYHVQ